MKKYLFMLTVIPILASYRCEADEIVRCFCFTNLYDGNVDKTCKTRNKSSFFDGAEHEPISVRIDKLEPAVGKCGTYIYVSGHDARLLGIKKLFIHFCINWAPKTDTIAEITVYRNIPETNWRLFCGGITHF